MSHTAFDEKEYPVASSASGGSFRRKPEPRNIELRSLDSRLRGNDGGIVATIHTAQAIGDCLWFAFPSVTTPSGNSG